MKAEEFDTKFDNDEDITEFLDLSQARRPGYEQKRVNIDFPVWMIEALEKEGRRLGITRDSIIKLWLSEHLKKKLSKSDRIYRRKRRRKDKERRITT
ncbi:type II toxin-antitoxin system BrnA family antitoxin [Sphaerospermopsis torques-reginae]|uniref:type II toxin-antitoxin system BrnA family antitoxin n=1 Tax=Sphaerospermopsis torques-reginae TaxID=984207 RepID=UPI001FE85331|nr:BrnA antitoxin family protein [Sphaerospermopsis torques-reginae]